jgi:hypothetical protein
MTAAGPRRTWILGRTFLHPVLDVALIGGIASFLVVALQLAANRADLPFPGPWLAVFVLAFNLAHFGASTVRLYSKPGTFRDLPWLTSWSPLLSMLLATIAIIYAPFVGLHVNALYLTWSPYHYAAQAYGLAVMYGIRSDRRLDDQEQGWLWWVCMLPFFYAFLQGTQSGVGWLLPESSLGNPALARIRAMLEGGVGALSFVAPLWLLVTLSRRGKQLPVISWLVVITNGIWWIVLPVMHAFVWATVFHGVQYLTIVLVFHRKDHPEGNALRSIIGFYAACLALGYALFELWPYAYVLLGYTLADSMLLCMAVINLHHFVVDRGIWRLRRDPNLRLVLERSVNPA